MAQKAFRIIHIHQRCTHQIQEARNYKWKVDKITNEVLPIIVDSTITVGTPIGMRSASTSSVAGSWRDGPNWGGEKVPFASRSHFIRLQSIADLYFDYGVQRMLEGTF